MKKRLIELSDIYLGGQLLWHDKLYVICENNNLDMGEVSPLTCKIRMFEMFKMVDELDNKIPFFKW